MRENNQVHDELEPDDIYEKIFDQMKFYVDEADTMAVFVQYRNFEGDYEFRSVKDKKFTAFVRLYYRELSQERKAPPHHAVLQRYIDTAIYEERTVKILSRMGGNANETAYFLADRRNRIVLINKDGRKLYKAISRYKFAKSRNILPQTVPKYGYNLLDELRPFLNMDNDMQVLYAVNLVQEFICNSSHFLCVISSPQGSGKSTFTNMWRKIVDPAQAVITTMPENADALKNQLANNLMVCFDNTQRLNGTYSDILCGAVTGTSCSKRKLYTDNAEIVMHLHNIVILNGIDIIPNQSDLLERSLLFVLNEISAKNRRSEEEIKQSFDLALPKILGAIFDTLVQYFKRKDSITVKGSHRMAGAYRDCYIIAKILGVEQQFLKAFAANQKLMNEYYSDINPIVSAVIAYMKDIDKKQKQGAVETLYNEIREYAVDMPFPKSPSAFSRKLKAQETALKNAGYQISIKPERTHSTLYIKQIGGR